MLEAAVAVVNRTGMTVSFDHIRLEDLIREADVSRSTVYRRWPYKDLFVSDLVKAVARQVWGTPAEIEDEIGGMCRVAALHADKLTTPEGRHQLLSEVIRYAAQLDFDRVYQSPTWRTYLALHATVASLPPGELRDDVQATLRRSQQEFVDELAAAWETLAQMSGYRLRRGGTGFETLATLLSATLRGLIIMATSTPELASERVQADPFGTGEIAEWCLAGVGIASIAASFLEPDPDIQWDDRRIEETRNTLVSQANPPL
jgi:AcrR family transcriptional regulator